MPGETTIIEIDLFIVKKNEILIGEYISPDTERRKKSNPAKIEGSNFFVAKMGQHSFYRVKRKCGKRRKCWYQHFLLFPTMFSMTFLHDRKRMNGTDKS